MEIVRFTVQYFLVHMGKDSCSKMGTLYQYTYAGRRYNNCKIIDSSRERDKVFKFRAGVGEVMSGWDKGLHELHFIIIHNVCTINCMA